MKKDNEIYTKEELELFKKIESGNYKSLPRKEYEKEKAKLEKAAENTMKRKSINIRLFEQDINKIKAMALSEGIPYQTYITSMLHKIATGRIKDINPN